MHVKFNKHDIRFFARSIFDNWKKRYERETDPEKQEKYERSATKNRRRQRQRAVSICINQLKIVLNTHIIQKKNDLLKAVDAYKEEHGVDPKPLIETDYMSEELSCKDSGTEGERAAHLNLMRRSAGLSQEEIDDEVDVYERVRIGFLLQEVSD